MEAHSFLLLTQPLPQSPVSKLPLFFLNLPVRRQLSLLPGEGGGRGAESYEHRKAWPSINHSILSLYHKCETSVLKI
jgi:hypothetical protein